ncbi:MAG TPA: PEP-CTERM sorting domain-containing protein [Roseiarcus sp.]|jgi:hypothetical protein
MIIFTRLGAQFVDALHKVQVFACVGGLLSAAALEFPIRQAEAATIFTNYDGTQTEAFGSPNYIAVSFILGVNAEFTGAAAFIHAISPLGNGPTPSFEMALYKADERKPGATPLWTSGSVNVDASETPNLVSVSDNGPQLFLGRGVEYFLALILTNNTRTSFVVWLDDGPNSLQTYGSQNGASWEDLGKDTFQFEINGAPLAAGAVPEPSTWALLLAGFIGLNFMGWRRSARSAARSAIG